MEHTRTVAPLVSQLHARMSVPVICAPMFIVSNPASVIAQCLNGVIGSFPALNARPARELDLWLTQIVTKLDDYSRQNPDARVAPFAVNQIVHHSNDRLDHDLDLCVKHRVPLIITSLRAPDDVVARVHAYGGKVFHDVTNVRHAERALAAGVDGLILVCAGAGGHAGTLNPFALVTEVRRFFDGPLALSGAISTGRGVLSARVLGADFAYMGTRFIASTEANANPAYKKMLVESGASDITYTPFFTGVPGNYLAQSIRAAGLDPDMLPLRDKSSMSFDSDRVRPWKDVWGAGQSVSGIDRVLDTAAIVRELCDEYFSARREMLAENREST